MKHERSVIPARKLRCAWQLSRGPLPLVIDLDGGVFRTDPVTAILKSALRMSPGLTARRMWQERKRPDSAALSLSLSLSKLTVPLSVHSSILDLLRVQMRMDGEICVLSSARRETARALCRAIGIDKPVTILSSGRDGKLDRDEVGRKLLLRFGARGYVFAGPARGNDAVIDAAQRAILLHAGMADKRRLLSKGIPVTLSGDPQAWVETCVSGDTLVDPDAGRRGALHSKPRAGVWTRPVAVSSARPVPVPVARVLPRYT